MAADETKQLRVAGLFAGIGGIELGLHRAGHRSALLCELDPAAQAVLRERFPDVPLHADATTLESLPQAELLCAGFPCQDLSQAGRTAGINGSQSSVVEHVFRLLDGAGSGLTWLALENVSFMLSLDRGAAMGWLVDRLEERGFTWAYRVVDSQAFGLPQRRQRVILLASRDRDPRPILLNQDQEANTPTNHEGTLACGFYWTEGLRGLGWAVDAVPTLKGGSGIGIPSPPAIWIPRSRQIVTPDLRDAERLQGFAADWTIAADSLQPASRRAARWKLIGNAVSVPVAEWLGRRLVVEETYIQSRDAGILSEGRWPSAAWGRAGVRKRAEVSMWPIAASRPHLKEFLEFATKPLSARATAGFLRRAERGNLRIPEDLIWEARAHLKSVVRQQARMAA